MSSCEYFKALVSNTGREFTKEEDNLNMFSVNSCLYFVSRVWIFLKTEIESKSFFLFK